MNAADRCAACGHAKARHDSTRVPFLGAACRVGWTHIDAPKRCACERYVAPHVPQTTSRKRLIRHGAT